jgi:hypothetical protein
MHLTAAPYSESQFLAALGAQPAVGELFLLESRPLLIFPFSLLLKRPGCGSLLRFLLVM